MQNSVSGIHDVQTVPAEFIFVLDRSLSLFISHCMLTCITNIFLLLVKLMLSAYRRCHSIQFWNMSICVASVSQHIHHNDFQIDLFPMYRYVCGCTGSFCHTCYSIKQSFQLILIPKWHTHKKKNPMQCELNSSQAFTNIQQTLWFMNYLVNLNECLLEVFLSLNAYSGMPLRTYMHLQMANIRLSPAFSFSFDTSPEIKNIHTKDLLRGTTLFVLFNCGFWAFRSSGHIWCTTHICAANNCQNISIINFTVSLVRIHSQWSIFIEIVILNVWTMFLYREFQIMVWWCT